jgi:protein AroM
MVRTTGIGIVARMTTSPTLGILTIGQSPRDDIVPVLRQFLPANTAITEVGCLDKLASRDLGLLVPRSEDDGIETRLRDGRNVVVSKSGLDALLRDCLETCPRPALFLCSSNFPSLDGVSGIIQPHELILPVMRHLASGHRLGVIGPESDLPRQPNYWHPHVPGARFAAGSPTDSEIRLLAVAETMAAQGCTMLFLDCMGFSEEQRVAIRRATGITVIAATTLVARLLPEIL